jgi:hypothetical protein
MRLPCCVHQSLRLERLLSLASWLVGHCHAAALSALRLALLVLALRLRPRSRSPACSSVQPLPLLVLVTSGLRSAATDLALVLSRFSFVLTSYCTASVVDSSLLSVLRPAARSWCWQLHSVTLNQPLLASDLLALTSGLASLTAVHLLGVGAANCLVASAPALRQSAAHAQSTSATAVRSLLDPRLDSTTRSLPTGHAVRQHVRLCAVRHARTVCPTCASLVAVLDRVLVVSM